MSLRDLMQEKVSALSVCRNCGKPIERRGSIWYATGEGVAADICRKAPTGLHKPIDKKR